MKKLYSPLFPCNLKREEKNLDLDLLKNKKTELVKFKEGYGCFVGRESLWIDDAEKEKLSRTNNNLRIFEFPSFESTSWYSFAPTELEIEVNRKCNLRCIHCWNESGNKHGELEKEIILSLIVEFRENGGQRLLITGGEPLLYPSLEELLSFAYKKGVSRLELISNGTLINNKFADLLSKYLPYVNISIHGHNSKVHDTVTGVNGSFNKAIEGIKKLKNRGTKSVLYFTIMEENFDSIPFMFDLTKQIGCEALRFNPVNCVGRAESKKTISLEAKTNLYKYLSKLSKKKNVQLITSELNREEYEDDFSYKFYGCNALRTLVYIASDGSALPCSLVENPVGNIKKQSLVSIWTNKESNNFRENYSYCNKKDCEILMNCGGKCKANYKRC